MYQRGYKYIILACYLVCPQVIFAENSNGSAVYCPSDNLALTCNGYENCSRDSCIFNSKIISDDVTNYFPSAENLIHCGKMILDIKFPPAKDSSQFGTYTALCFKYTNSENNSFDALEIIINKANKSSMHSTDVKCKSTNCIASLVNETSEEIMVIGIPSIGCTPYVLPKTPPSEYLPLNAPKLTCKNYKNCTSDACNFNRALKSNDTSRYIPSSDIIFRCQEINLEITFPSFKDESGIGTYTVWCFEYKSNQNITFDALQMIIQKPKDSIMNSTRAVCNSANCKASLLNETSNEITIVALLTSECTPDVPSPTEASVYLPSESPVLSCKGITNSTSDFCDFRSTLIRKDLSGYFPSMDVLYHCGDITLEIVFPPAENKSVTGTTSASCYKYTDSNNASFDALQVITKKAENSNHNSTNATCLSNNCKAQVLNESSEELTIVALQTNDCTPIFRPIPAVPSVHLPSEAPHLTCNDFKNSTGDTCNFNRSLKSNDTARYVPSTENLIRCGDIILDVKLPEAKDSSVIGTYTSLCYSYTSINNMTFDILQLMVNKARDSKMNTVVVSCRSENCIEKIVNETADDIIIVAMLSNMCSSHLIPTFEAVTTANPTVT